MYFPTPTRLKIHKAELKVARKQARAAHDRLKSAPRSQERVVLEQIATLDAQVARAAQALAEARFDALVESLETGDKHVSAAKARDLATLLVQLGCSASTRAGGYTYYRGRLADGRLLMLTIPTDPTQCEREGARVLLR